jgi:hypothetical protein
MHYNVDLAFWAQAHMQMESCIDNMRSAWRLAYNKALKQLSANMETVSMTPGFAALDAVVLHDSIMCVEDQPVQARCDVVMRIDDAPAPDACRGLQATADNGFHPMMRQKGDKLGVFVAVGEGNLTAIALRSGGEKYGLYNIEITVEANRRHRGPLVKKAQALCVAWSWGWKDLLSG